MPTTVIQAPPDFNTLRRPLKGGLWVPTSLNRREIKFQFDIMLKSLWLLSSIYVFIFLWFYNLLEIFSPLHSKCLSWCWRRKKKTMKICRKSSKIVSGFLRNTMYAYSKYVPQAWIKLILYTLKMPAMSVISSIFHKCPDRQITSITAKPYILQKPLFHSICSKFY